MDEELKDKRQAILAAALDLIAGQGFQNAPMSQIARQANAGVGTIYRYFTSKDDMINVLYVEIKKQITSAMFGDYREGTSLPKAFRQIMRNLLALFIENPRILSFYEQYVNSPLITAATLEEVHRVMAPVDRMFQLAREQELIKPMPVGMMGEMIYCAVATLAKYAIANGAEPADLESGIGAIWDMVRQ